MHTLAPKRKLCAWCGVELTPVDWTLLADGTLVPIIIGANLALVVHVARLAHSIHRRQTTPVGTLILGNYDDMIFVGIGNAGIGPMKIRNLKATSRDGTADAEGTIRSFLQSASEIEGRTVNSFERLTLLSFGFVPGSRFDDARRARIREILKDITIELCYTDSREKVEYTLTQDLSLFGKRRPARA